MGTELGACCRPSLSDPSLGADYDDSATGIDELIDIDSEIVPLPSDVVHVIHEPLVPVPAAMIGHVGLRVDLYICVQELDQLSEIAATERFEPLFEDLDVLLRHRPRSIAAPHS